MSCGYSRDYFITCLSSRQALQVTVHIHYTHILPIELQMTALQYSRVTFHVCNIALQSLPVGEQKL